MISSPLVTAAWLQEQLGRTDLLILDASLYLPNEPQDADELYRQQHIPGALRFDIDLFSDPDTSLPHMVPSAGRFARLAGELGVMPATFIVAYDQKGLFSAARAWWLFRLFGHEQVAVLDGGLPHWRDLGLPLEAGENRPEPQAPYPTALNNRLLCGLGDVQTALAVGQTQVLDARGAKRFAGEVPEPRPGVASGHMPGSLNLPYDSLLTAAGTLLSPQELRQRFQALGVDGLHPVITSCGSGVTAAVLLLALSVAGLPDGRLYDGSWSEWGQHQATPKALGHA
ncbi:3-mercaptopyruvate sulfurtransferase [Pseudomonas rhizoryzae]|uniref:3-mercaptopyruvate sulfurtransferase n=1 Tax=Pseudomonas rhizoryzae TaxID=2571129 RepID=UPI0007378BC7|nr:3-mercaptopyruvate sulfurtransferase [Pseudomonas rhizoryzae]KTT33173.1 3-mercaptopyruvate sulfurtransferase [Pseudomonas psychrotolerans]KTT37735.1 3-mercaptopyruvate sulfurtransferase [Pseudomonas psychrotolerans]KTT76398.1 3-mercaptopyruvate sulfurtransferase [Pseudomonas psychrotolerans]